MTARSPDDRAGSHNKGSGVACSLLREGGRNEAEWSAGAQVWQEGKKFVVICVDCGVGNDRNFRARAPGRAMHAMSVMEDELSEAGCRTQELPWRLTQPKQMT